MRARRSSRVAGEAGQHARARQSSDGDASTIWPQGNDFYCLPAPEPGRSQLAWLTWNHPNMPWDGTELWVADCRHDGRWSSKQPKSPAAIDESIFQPEWSPDGTLYFVSDRTGWWNLYRWRRKARIEAALSDGSGIRRSLSGSSASRLYGFESDGDASSARYAETGVATSPRLDTATGKRRAHRNCRSRRSRRAARRCRPRAFSSAARRPSRLASSHRSDDRQLRSLAPITAIGRSNAGYLSVAAGHRVPDRRTA